MKIKTKIINPLIPTMALQYAIEGDAGLLIKETFKNALDYLQFDNEESTQHSCDQCGNYNHYAKLTRNG